MRCDVCNKTLVIGDYPFCPHGFGAMIQGGLDPNTHPSERVVVYESLKEGGKIQYPGRNDTPVPERLARRGYVRKELNVRDLAKFEQQHGVVNERRHYDRNGRNYEDS